MSSALRNCVLRGNTAPVKMTAFAMQLYEIVSGERRSALTDVSMLIPSDYEFFFMLASLPIACYPHLMSTVFLG